MQNITTNPRTKAFNPHMVQSAHIKVHSKEEMLAALEMVAMNDEVSLSIRKRAIDIMCKTRSEDTVARLRSIVRSQHGKGEISQYAAESALLLAMTKH